MQTNHERRKRVGNRIIWGVLAVAAVLGYVGFHLASNGGPGLLVQPTAMRSAAASVWTRWAKAPSPKAISTIPGCSSGSSMPTAPRTNASLC